MFEIVSIALSISTLVICLAVIVANIMYPMGRSK